MRSCVQMMNPGLYKYAPAMALKVPALDNLRHSDSATTSKERAHSASECQKHNVMRTLSRGA